MSAKYEDDLTDCLERQINHMKSVYSATFEKTLEPLELLNAIYDMELQSIYGDLYVLLCVFLCLPVTVSGGERVFSRTILIFKTNKQTKKTLFVPIFMPRDRLNGLARLSIVSRHRIWNLKT